MPNNNLTVLPPSMTMSWSPSRSSVCGAKERNTRVFTKRRPKTALLQTHHAYKMMYPPPHCRRPPLHIFFPELHLQRTLAAGETFNILRSSKRPASHRSTNRPCPIPTTTRHLDPPGCFRRTSSPLLCHLKAVTDASVPLRLPVFRPGRQWYLPRRGHLLFPPSTTSDNPTNWY